MTELEKLQNSYLEAKLQNIYREAKLQNSNTKGEVMETPRTDKAAFTANFGGTVVVDADFAQRLELENRDLRALLDKASQAIACFVELRGMAATELKSAHNGICIFLDATRMLDAIKAGVGEGD